MNMDMKISLSFVRRHQASCRAQDCMRPTATLRARVYKPKTLFHFLYIFLRCHQLFATPVLTHSVLSFVSFVVKGKQNQKAKHKQIIHKITGNPFETSRACYDGDSALLWPNKQASKVIKQMLRRTRQTCG